MPVEIRQLVVKSNLVQAARESETGSLPKAQEVNTEQLRLAVLAECRELIAEAMALKQER